MNPYTVLPHQDFPAMDGAEVRWMMRSRKVAIRALAARFGLTLKHVREVREHGAPAGFPAWEWHWMIAEASLSG